MTNWPRSNGGRIDEIDPGAPHENQNPPSQAQGTYQQPWGNAPSVPHQTPGTAGDYQQRWDQPAPLEPSAQQRWNQPAPQGPSAQPWTQQPSHGGPPPDWGPGPSELGGPTPQKSRKGMLIAVAVVALVAALAFVGYRVSSGEGIAGIGATPTLSAGETVQQYLEALAAGDAEKALSFGASQPASTELLTNEILAQQNAAMPISNIRILDQDNAEYIGSATVHVAVNFGDVVDDAQLRLTKDADDVWKLENAAVKIDPPTGAAKINALSTVTIFGKNLDKGSLYLFPGYMDVGSSNGYIGVAAKPILLQGLAKYSSSYPRPEVDLNEAGSQAIKQALADDFANCQDSSQLNPTGCPTKVSGYDSRGAVDGTVKWGKADLSGVTIGQLNQFGMTVSISGKATMPLSYETTKDGTKSGIVTVYVSAQADMTTTPPTLKWR